MQQFQLGQTDLKVSELCLGTMMMGSQTSKNESFKLLDCAYEHGINFFDTAEGYAIPFNPSTHGFSEDILGEWLRQRGLRDKVTIASKVTGRSKMFWLRGSKNKLARKLNAALGKETSLDKKNIDYAVNNSLKRLKIDFIDLYQIHWPDRPINKFGQDGVEAPLSDPNYVSIEETLSALDLHVKAGRIKAIGISNENTTGTHEYIRLADAAGLPRIATIQNAYSLVNRTFENDLQALCEKETISLLPYSCLAMGYLTGKYMCNASPSDSRKNRYVSEGLLNRYKSLSDETVLKYQAIADEAGLSLSELAIAFVKSRPFVQSTIIAATNTIQLQENINAVNIKLNDSSLAAINSIHQSQPNPCP